MVLIVGGSGHLGRSTAQLLLQRGAKVRILARTPDKVADLRRLGAEVVQGDLRDAASLHNACAGATSVFVAAHSILGRGKTSSRLVDGVGQESLIDAAKTADVQHVVFTSVHGASPDHPVDFWRTKYAVEEHLRAAGLPFTILRPTAFFIPHATLIGEPLLKRGRTTILGRGNNPRNFVAIEDVAQFALRALSDPQAGGDVIEIGGPDNLTNNQVAELYARIASIEPKIMHVPPAVLRVMPSLLKPVHPGLSTLLASSLYADTADETFDPTPTLRKYPVALTRLEDWIQAQMQASPQGIVRAEA